jgi:hypothetical protein
MARRNEGRAKQTVTEAVSNPLAVFNVRLTARNRFDVTSINENNFKVTIEEIENRLPVNTSAFNSDVRALVIKKPIQHTEKVCSHSRESASVTFTVFDETSDSGFSVNINTAAGRVKNLDRKPPFNSGEVPVSD